MVSRRDSESRRSPSAVEPFRSQKRIVTSFRTSCAGAAGASAVPQKPQRRKRGGFSSPQLGQICTEISVGGGLTVAKAAARPRRARPRSELELVELGRISFDAPP